MREYTVAISDSKIEFEENCSQCLQNGWQLHGKMIVKVAGDIIYYLQAFVK